MAEPTGLDGPGPGGRKWRVLLVDDCSRTMRLIEAELARDDLEVLKANSADEATRMIIQESSRPDLILLDVNMPGVNGAQFCRFVKGNSQFAGIKVILCSSMDVDELERTCREAGADDFVPKEQILGKWVTQRLIKD